MLLICLYAPGILSIEGVQSLGFALNLEASPPIGGDSIVSVDGHRFVKSVRWYRRLLRGTVDTKQHFINSAVHRFEKQNNLISLCWSTIACNITASFVSMVYRKLSTKRWVFKKRFKTADRSRESCEDS